MVPLQPHSSSESSCLKVTLVETAAIPAASEIEVKARVCAPSNKHVWMIEVKSLERMLPKDIGKDHKEKISALLELYADINAMGDNGLGRTGILRHNINTGNASPIFQQVRRRSLPAKEKFTRT